MYVSIITSYVSGLNAPTKRHRLADWIRKQDYIYMLPPRDPSETERYTLTKNIWMEKDISCKRKGKNSYSSSIYTQ